MKRLKIASMTLLTALTFLIPSVSFAQEAEEALVKVGQVAPVFAANTVDGGKFSLANMKGQVVVLSFFATWCGPCRAELPYLQKEIWTPFKDKGLTVLLIGREHSFEEVKNFVSTAGLAMPAIADTDRKIYAQYASKSIPRTFVIDKLGKIAYCSVGFEGNVNALKAVVQKLLASPIPAVKANSPAEEKAAAELAAANLLFKSATDNVRSGQYEKASGELKTFLQKWPKHVQGHYLLGVSYAALKNYDAAADEYRQVIKLADDPKMKTLAQSGLQKIHKSE